MPQTDPTIKYKDFAGINNVQPADRLAPTDLRYAENIDISDTGRAARRNGYTLRLAGNFHSAYGYKSRAFVVDRSAAQLCALYPWYTVPLVGLTDAETRISYAPAYDSIYWTNGTERGRIDVNGNNHSWGFNPPSLPPSLSAVYGVGGLKAGRYFAAVTFADAGGLETTPAFSALCELSEDGAIDFSALPQSPHSELPFTNLYMTNANGDRYYYVGSFNGETTWRVTGGTYTIDLRTQYLNPPPSGKLLCFHEERMFIASGRYLFYSEQHDYEHFDLRQNFFGFEGDITVMASLPGGLWVVADRTYFIQGTRPDNMNRIIADAHGDAYPYSAVVTEANTIGLQVSGRVALWTSKHGVFAGTSGGELIRVAPNYRPPRFDAETGAAMVREQNGLKQYLFVAQDTGATRTTAYTGDRVAAEVWRCGVRVQ